MRIRVLVREVAIEPAGCVELGNEKFVRLLKEHSADDVEIVVEVTIRADWVDHGQAVGPARGKVICAKRWGLVYESCAVVGGDVVGEDDEVRVRDVYVGERADVAQPLKVATGESMNDLIAFAGVCRDKVLGHEQVLTCNRAHHRVRGSWLGGHGCIRDQGPWGCGPNQ